VAIITGSRTKKGGKEQDRKVNGREAASGRPEDPWQRTEEPDRPKSSKDDEDLLGVILRGAVIKD